jgi:dihydroorotase
MGATRNFVKTMAAAGTTIVVDCTKAWANVNMVCASMVSSSALDLYASVDGSAFYQVKTRNPTTATVQINSFVIAASTVVNGGIVPIPAGFQYYRLLATDSAPAAAIGFTVVCSDD